LVLEVLGRQVKLTKDHLVEILFFQQLLRLAVAVAVTGMMGLTLENKTV
jgi:hypothetical protein